MCCWLFLESRVANASASEGLVALFECNGRQRENNRAEETTKGSL